MNHAVSDSQLNIKRSSILRIIEDAFAACNKQVVNLYGESGRGKSFICRHLYENWSSIQLTSVLIDFDQSEYTSIPGVIGGIIANLGAECFHATIELLNDYVKSVDASKTETLSRCVDMFIEDINHIISRERILFIFDTFEALPSAIQNNEFRSIISRFGNNAMVVISGVDEISWLEVSKRIFVDGFNTREITEYFIARDRRLKKLFKGSGELNATEIHLKTNSGHPILCGLLADYIIQHGNADTEFTEELLGVLFAEESDLFYGQLISWIGELPNELKTAIRITAYFNSGMTPQMLGAISELPYNECVGSLRKMCDFSFVKSSNEGNRIMMHKIAADMIKRMFPYENAELQEYAVRAEKVYTDMLDKDSHRSEAYREQSSLRTERAMCIIKYCDFKSAVKMFDEELLVGLLTFDYSFISQLTSAIAKWVLETDDARWRFLLDLAEGEILLNRYYATKALVIANELKAVELCEDCMLAAMVDSFYGRCFVNPGAITDSVELGRAIASLNNCLSVLEQNRFKARTVKTAFWLGVAYMRNGQNDNAQDMFEYAKNHCSNNIQLITIIMEQSKMLRLQQDVDAANNVMQSYREILFDGIPQKNKGKYYYYKGNIERDLGNYESAKIWYDMAFTELEKHDDDFTLCELNLDYGWLEFLWKEKYDKQKVLDYIMAGKKIAEEYNFGTEYSEVHHMLYELYHEEGKDSDAYRELDMALQDAYKYSNMYMIMDCLNHKALMHYELSDFDKVHDIIVEMNRLQDNGCKIRVFTGRAMLIQGDIYYDNSEYDRALREYLEGFMIIALYGNSFSNVELFGSLFAAREEKIACCKSRNALAQKTINAFKSRWIDSGVKNEFIKVINKI